jgi:hypothetical protein
MTPTNWLDAQFDRASNQLVGTVDGSERVGASPRQTADLRKIVTYSQIHTT